MGRERGNDEIEQRRPVDEAEKGTMRHKRQGD